MTEQEVLEAQPTTATEPDLEVESTAKPSAGKWTAISADQPVCEVASRVLAARLKALCRSFPLAAEKSDADVEHVHQLRIAVRRAVEAVRVFAGLMEEAEVGALRDRLRRIRLAADDARNWDVLAERFAHASDVPPQIVERIQARRQEVQGPIVTAYQEFMADGCAAKFEKLVEEVETHRHGEGKRRFERQTPRYLAPVVKKFFKAAVCDLNSEDSLHGLRIRAKKLRYTMEIVAGACDSAFRRKLYPRVTLFQNLLGTVNDHATAGSLFRDWLSKTEEIQQKAFLEGLLLAEERATADLREAFLATWTPKVVSSLKRQFRRYC
jgi:CHAD domain-containing protein